MRRGPALVGGGLQPRRPCVRSPRPEPKASGLKSLPHEQDHRLVLYIETPAFAPRVVACGRGFSPEAFVSDHRDLSRGHRD